MPKPVQAFSVRLGMVAIFAVSASPLSAQRTTENALRAAEDAFGTSIGSESIGLYNPDNVRGFSPFAAGNVRIEGLYLDAVTGFNNRLVRGSTVRVGISAQGYPFPAPTGIADFRLRLPGDATAVSGVISGESWGGIRAELDVQTPLADGLSIGGGGHISRDRALWAGSAIHASAAALLRWQPSDSTEIIPFWSGLIHRTEDTQPRFVMTGNVLPPRVGRFDYIAQPWAQNGGEDVNYGVIARHNSAHFQLSAGVFRTLYQNDGSYSNQFLDTDADGNSARHVVVASPAFRRGSVSGEVRGTWQTTEGPRRHALHVSVRARSQSRRYGGSTSVDFGAASIFAPGIQPEPAFIFGPQSRDEIEQTTLGLGYEGRWAGVGEFGIGIQRADYRKTATIPGRNDPATEATPWLFNASGAVHISGRIALYGGFTRGLEESPVAPDIAVNRDDAPPALLTRQYDGGIRWSPVAGTRLVAGLFNVEKPYFNLDPDRRYRDLGTVRHRGAELSLTAAITPALDIVAGAVLLDARVLGEAVADGLVGERPVGVAGRTILFSTEYRPPRLPGLALDAAITHYGHRPANSANTLEIPSWTQISIGARYQWQLAGRPTTLRLQLNNLANAYVWEIRASNAFFYNAPRHLVVRLTRDF